MEAEHAEPSKILTVEGRAITAVPPVKKGSCQRGPSVKPAQKAKWRESYIEGVKAGKWETPLQFWTRELRPLGVISKPSFWKISGREHWASAGRMVRAETHHADVMEEQTRKRQKLIEAYQATGEMATSVLKKVKMALRKGAELNPGDLKRLSETIAKSHETLSLALDRPTAIVDGVPTVSIQYFTEAAPYQLGDGVSVPTSVDGESHVVEGQTSGSERGAENTEDGYVPQVGIGKDADQPVQGGGVVSLPVLPTGEDGSVAEVDRHIGEPADKVDSGEAKRN